MGFKLRKNLFDDYQAGANVSGKDNRVILDGERELDSEYTIDEYEDAHTSIINGEETKPYRAVKLIDEQGAASWIGINQLFNSNIVGDVQRNTSLQHIDSDKNPKGKPVSIKDSYDEDDKHNLFARSLKNVGCDNLDKFIFLMKKNELKGQTIVYKGAVGRLVTAKKKLEFECGSGETPKKGDYYPMVTKLWIAKN